MTRRTQSTNADIPIAPGIGQSFVYRLKTHARSGLMLYWGSFLALIFIELFIGGQLSGILARENYAIYVHVLNNLPFYSVLINAGLAYGIIYIISYNNKVKYSLLRQATQIQIAWYLLLAGLHLAAWFFLRDAFFTAALIAMIISFAYSLRLNATSFFIATGSYKKAALSNMLQKSALLLIFIIVRYYAQAIDIVNKKFEILYTGIELGVVLLYLLFFAHTACAAVSAPKVTIRKRLIKYGRYAMLNNGLNVAYYSIIAFIIRSAHVGIHMQITLGLCLMFFRYTAVSVAPFFSTMAPQLTLIKNDIPRVRNMYKKYLALTLLVGVATMVACRLLFHLVIDHFYSATYADLPAYFYPFCYLVPVLFLNSLHGSALAALGKIKYTTGIEIISTILLSLFLTWSLLHPIVSFSVFYYIVLIHLLVRFALLANGMYKAVKTPGP